MDVIRLPGISLLTGCELTLILIYGNRLGGFSSCDCPSLSASSSILDETVKLLVQTTL